MKWNQTQSRIIKIIALAMACYHFYVVIFGVPSVFFFRGTHLLFSLVLIFLLYPLKENRAGLTPRKVLNALCLLFSIACIAHIFVNHDYILNRFAYVDDLSIFDLVLGTGLLILTLDATRRVIGLALPLTASIFLCYALFIDRISYGQLVDQMYLTTEGIFGIPLNVSASYMVLFILFGALVERSGTGKLFRDFSLALAGSSAGGPAKVACVTSAMFGTVSGSSTANVMTTGAFTIPLMKKMGYRPAFSGAVEAVASTGGQILPPIMGAAAFVMAEMMAVSYLTVISMALIPAVLYFVAVFLAVHFEAKRTGLKGLPKPDLPRLSKVLSTRGHQFIPLLIIIGVLVLGYSPPYAALCGLVSVLPVALLGKTSRQEISWKTFTDAMITGIRNTLVVSSACASAGIVIGVISQTGIGIGFTQLVASTFSSEHLLIALILTAIAGILLGMGLPTTPAYIVQAALLAPALVKLGIPRESAHLFVFYFAILSAITPPVAISLYAANGLSGAGLWDSGLAAVKLAATGYIIPFMFVFAPSLLLLGPWYEVAWSAGTALIGVVCLASSLHGYLLKDLRYIYRFLLFAGALGLMSPGIVSDGLGFLVLVIILLVQTMIHETDNPSSRSLG
jgi:TRAP transporter 4TM/12TM fusion protein